MWLGAAPAPWRSCAAQSGPTPSVAPSPSATPTPKGQIQFRAVIQNANGEPIKVARTSFTALPYDAEALRLAVEKRNNPGPKPSFSEPEPKATDARFQNQLSCLTELESGQALGRFPPRDGDHLRRLGDDTGDAGGQAGSMRRVPGPSPTVRSSTSRSERARASTAGMTVPNRSRSETTAVSVTRWVPVSHVYDANGV